MSDSDWPNRIETLKRLIDRALPIVLIVLVAAGAGALAVVSTDYFSPYKHESSEKNYYQTECYRLELTKPEFATIEDQNSTEGRKAQAEWNKDSRHTAILLRSSKPPIVRGLVASMPLGRWY